MAEIMPVPTLADYERAELRAALGYHFDECADGVADLDDQLTVLGAVVERILGRRDFASLAQRAVDGMVF